MFNTKSHYALNKYDRESILYMGVCGHTRLLKSDFETEEEFLKWKEWSDLDYYEQERQERGFYDNCVPLTEEAGSDLSAEMLLFHRVEKEELRENVKSLHSIVRNVLSEKQYQRFWMFHIEQKTVVEIAQGEGTTRSTVSQSIQYAVKKLQQAFRED